MRGKKKKTMRLCIYASLHLIPFVLCYLLFAPAQAIELQGGVAFTVDSAREYVQEGTPYGIEIPGNYYQLREDNIERKVYSYNNNHDIIGITVQYINDPYRTYIYNKNKTLIFTEKYDKPVNIYPHRGYRYNLDGKLILTSLTVSKNEMFRFNPNGKLIAHSINGVIYDENGEIIGNSK